MSAATSVSPQCSCRSASQAGSWTSSIPLREAIGGSVVFRVLASPVAGIFWLFALTVFADWKVTALTLTPAAILLVTGMAQPYSQETLLTGLWSARNLLGAALAVHAGVLILRGWSDDLVEPRRRFRALLLSLSCLLVLVEVSAGFAFRVTHDARWLAVVVGHPLGGLVVAALTLGMAGVALTIQPAAFGAACVAASRRSTDVRRRPTAS